MNAVLQLKARAAGRVELTGRAAALAEIDEHINNLKNCLHWLIEQGFVVNEADMRRGKARPLVRIAPSPRLHVLFKDDCAWREREQLGTALVKYTWFAIRYGVHIEWEEVTCA